ncbi:leucyl/phenylalanyl-tRNA--protein transferase [Flocculibacter collagenilyticus]|uniref:leucyl/phenylalanyl-tRNA--protein transferase n=1 Tax=Flocculibacter collagenilyticus TaxID=2744479 RepID=UPI0018F63DC7|nr:leucyl/phenylalanyl-tRNA--protein transferase [Flocculibacter collagenilyticus]
MSELCVYQLPTDKHLFPSPEYALAEPNGLLAVGGDLNPHRLMTAYYYGIFPWFSDGEPIMWWSPNPRAILDLSELHVSRSLKKLIRKTPFTITLNHCFEDVIHACAAPRDTQDETWITQDMINAYTQLHQNGKAHSIEIWQNNMLVGGLYGVLIGGCFCGESMFSLMSNASKVAYVALVQWLQSIGATMIDCQMQTSHLATLGSKEVSRSDFIYRLEQVRDKHLTLQSPAQLTIKLDHL